ncbi:MAG: PIN domain-containing protein [Dehalococcoidia bacterium]
MMRALLDTNVVLDWLLEREPWFSEGAALWQQIEAGRIIGSITSTTVTDIFSIARRATDLQRARSAVEICLRALEICPVHRSELEKALDLPGNDYEDNLQVVCARAASLDTIVTRDPAGFQSAPMPVLSPVDAAQRAG